MNEIIALFAIAAIGVVQLVPLFWSADRRVGLDDPAWIRRQRETSGWLNRTCRSSNVNRGQGW